MILLHRAGSRRPQPKREAERMPRRGFTLLEILTAMFLLGLLGYLVVRFLLPIILSSNRMLAGISAADPVERALAQIHRDVYQATSKGLSFASTPQGDWTLGLVRRSQPSSEAQTLWEKELRVYRYHGDRRSLTFQLYSDLRWPDGEPRLTGAEPLHFSSDELTQLSLAGESVLATFVTATGAWTAMRDPWGFDYAPPESAKGHYVLSLAGDLD